MTTYPAYPFVRCESHPGADEPGYAVCKHVISGAPVASYTPATNRDLGTVICADCARQGVLGPQDPDQFTLCCARSVRDAGWDKAKEKIQ